MKKTSYFGIILTLSVLSASMFATYFIAFEHRNDMESSKHYETIVGEYNKIQDAIDQHSLYLFIKECHDLAGTFSREGQDQICYLPDQV